MPVTIVPRPVRLVNHCFTICTDRTGRTSRVKPFTGRICSTVLDKDELSESDILAQYRNCHITMGSVNEWRDFEDGVHGETEVIPPSC